MHPKAKTHLKPGIVLILPVIILVVLPMRGSGQSLQQKRKFLPYEYETAGGNSLALSSSGVAHQPGLGAVKINPALLALTKDYRIEGAYNWPSQGRDFYQAGIYDGKTSNFTAGLLYTSFVDDYEFQNSDSPLKRRIHLALAKGFGRLHLGLNVHYLEAFSFEQERLTEVHGTTMGMGALLLVSENLKIGASVENLSNKKVKPYAPQTLRFGLGLVPSPQSIDFHVEYSHRQRVAGFESCEDIQLAGGGEVRCPSESLTESEAEKQAEQLITGAVTLSAYRYFKLIASYGQAIDSQRATAALGAVLGTEKMQIGYLARRPNLKYDSSQQSLNLSLNLKM